MLISGDVQGVGFRYRANYAARGLGLTGYVRNLYDGRVELEVQGNQDLISRFLGEIDAGSFVHIDDIETENMPLDENERGFRSSVLLALAVFRSFTATEKVCVLVQLRNISVVVIGRYTKWVKM